MPQCMDGQQWKVQENKKPRLQPIPKNKKKLSGSVGAEAVAVPEADTNACE